MREKTAATAAFVFLCALSMPSGADAEKSADGEASSARVLEAGDKAQVSWSGGWYAASVLEVGAGRYKVRYDGWSGDWDEWVGPERMRLADGVLVKAPPAAASTPVSPAKPVPGTEPPPAPDSAKIWSSSPAGRWACRTWDAGRVDRVAEFVLEPDGGYRDLRTKKAGRYLHDRSSNRVAFLSGPQKTKATISFNPSGHAGKGHLWFDYGGGARLDCYREALR